jgi:Flp pilus assembly protein TadB
MTILIPVVGILSTTLVLLLWYPKQIKTGRLSALYTVDSARTLSSLDQKSLEYKLLASGLNIKPVTFRLLRIAAGVCGMVIAWLFLPGLPAIVIGGIVIYIPGAWLDDRVKSRGRNIDQLLPIAIGRTAAGLLAGGSVPDVLQQVGESLEIEKPIHSPQSLFSLLQKCESKIGWKHCEVWHRAALRCPWPI